MLFLTVLRQNNPPPPRTIPPPTKNKPAKIPPPPLKISIFILLSPLCPPLPLPLILRSLLPLLLHLLLSVASPLLLVYRYRSTPASTPLLYPLPINSIYFYHCIYFLRTSTATHLLLLLLHLPLHPNFYSTYTLTSVFSLPYPFRCFNFYPCGHVLTFTSTPLLPPKSNFDFSIKSVAFL